MLRILGRQAVVAAEPLVPLVPPRGIADGLARAWVDVARRAVQLRLDRTRPLQGLCVAARGWWRRVVHDLCHLAPDRIRLLGARFDRFGEGRADLAVVLRPYAQMRGRRERII